jgi:hypothetical protein
MRILEVHSRVNTHEQIAEYKDHFDAIYVMGVWRPTEFSKQHNAKYQLDPSLFAIENHIELDVDLMAYKQHEKPIVVDFIANHVGIVDNFKQGFLQEDGTWKLGTDGYGTWVDVYQLNYTLPEVIRGMYSQLKLLAGVPIIAGVRCDMAHLLLSDIYNKNHGTSFRVELWKIMIDEIRKFRPDFCFIAEAYDKRQELINCGFDYVYEDARQHPYIPFTKSELFTVDTHDNDFRTAYFNQFALENNLTVYSNLPSTLWYLPAILGYTYRPSANYYINRDWHIDKTIAKIYRNVLDTYKNNKV